MRNTCENVAGTVHIISALKNQLKPICSSNYLSQTLVATGRLTDYSKGSLRKGGLTPCKSQKLEKQVSNYLSREKTSDICRDCTCNILDKKYYSTSFDFNMNGAASCDVFYESGSGKYMGKNEVKRSEEKYVKIEEWDSSYPRRLNYNPVKKNCEHCVKLKHEIEHKSLAIDHALQFSNTHFGSKSVESIYESPNNSKRTFTKQRSKTILGSSLKQSYNKFNNQSSELQNELHKSRSFQSINPSTQEETGCSSNDFNTFRKIEASSTDSSHITNVQSLMILFDDCDKRRELQETSKGVSNHLHSQSPCTPSVRVKKKTSSNIQRIQEQLGLKIVVNEKICNSSKISKIQEHYSTECKEHFLSVKNNFSYTDRLEKLEKPYRQWQRVSRVVTADSKFIISPMLSKYLLPCAKGITQIRNEQEESLEPVDEIKTYATIKESHDDIESTFDSDYNSGRFKSELHCEDAKSKSLSLKHYAAYGEEESPRKEKTENQEFITMDCNKKNSDTEMSLGKIFTDCSRNEPRSGKLNSTETNMPFKTNIKVLPTRIIKGNVLIRSPTSIMIPQSPPLQKSLTQNSLRSTRYIRLNELGELCISSKKKLVSDVATSNTVNKIKPLSSVSGVSQVTGPSFSVRKKDCILEMQPKKSVYAGPKLRTAERSRNRGKSPAQINTITSIAANNNSAFCKDYTNVENNFSRNSSRNSSHESHSFISDISSQITALEKPQIGTKPINDNITEVIKKGKDGVECINRNWSSGNASVVANNKESRVNTTKTNKVFLVDVASKLFQKANRSGLRVPRNESAKKYLDVEATRDYTGSLPGQLSFRRGQKIKQISTTKNSDGMSYGYYRVGRLRKKRKGLFPSVYVTSNITDSADGLDCLVSPIKSTD